MAVGEVLKEATLIIEEFTVKSNEDIEKGEIVYNDGNGILAATSVAKGPFFMALKAHDYSEESTHKVKCVVKGCVECQKDTATGYDTALVQGRYVEIGHTAGEVLVFDYASPGNWYDVVGESQAAALEAAETAKIWLGKR